MNVVKKGFTFTEVAVCVLIVICLAGMIIPSVVEGCKRADALRTVVGKTFEVNGMKILVVDYSHNKYKVVLLRSDPVPVDVAKELIDEAYKQYVKAHPEKQ